MNIFQPTHYRHGIFNYEIPKEEAEEKVQVVESDVALYGDIMVRDIAAVGDDVAIIEAGNIEKL